MFLAKGMSRTEVRAQSEFRHLVWGSPPDMISWHNMG